MTIQTEPTLFTEDQSVSCARALSGDIVPCTTAFIFSSIQVRSDEATRTTKSAVVAIDTPYRLMASVICGNTVNATTS